MGILNVTPDSFSGDGLWDAGPLPEVAHRAISQAEAFLSAGVDILDVGGESTRPGAAPVPAEAECARILPVIEALAGHFSVPISVDTSKAEVADRALRAGAQMVNDVWGLRMDPDMAGVVAAHRVPVVLMHNRSRSENAAQSEKLGGRYVGIQYGDLVADVIAELRTSIQLAVEAGIKKENIIIDPGIGFGKAVAQNLELLDRLPELQVLGFPILVGPSRKSFIGYTLHVPPEERTWGTAAAVALCVARGADIIRVHDVLEMGQVCRMADAIVRRKRPDA
ncbi:MAG: dihydropteroate synthase [Chloroflexi bacterium]|nr:dihydropteroate synthase [Chloroflexota bacterium]